MDIVKKFRVAAPQSEVWEFITSAEKVAACLPGCEEVQVEGPGQYKGVMTIKVGPIKTSVNANVTEVEQRAPTYASYAIKGEEGGRVTVGWNPSVADLLRLDQPGIVKAISAEAKAAAESGKGAGALRARASHAQWQL